MEQGLNKTALARLQVMNKWSRLALSSLQRGHKVSNLLSSFLQFFLYRKCSSQDFPKENEYFDRKLKLLETWAHFRTKPTHTEWMWTNLVIYQTNLQLLFSFQVFFISQWTSSVPKPVTHRVRLHMALNCYTSPQTWNTQKMKLYLTKVHYK